MVLTKTQEYRVIQPYDNFIFTARAQKVCLKEIKFIHGKMTISNYH